MAIAKMPNSCELQDSLGKDWAIQAKPVGAGPEEYVFIPGLTSINVNISTQSTDTTTIDADGWTTDLKHSRSLTIEVGGKVVLRNGSVPDKAQNLVRASGQELGALGKLDVRVWRTDSDEGWEVTANNEYSEASGDALRTFTSNLKSACRPTRIKAVLEGATDKASVEVDEAEYLKILEPTGAVAGGDADGS